METLIILLLMALIGLVLFGILRNKTAAGSEDKMHALLNDKFLGFQQSIHTTMETARREVEMSKTVISDHAIKTLDTIKNMGSTLEKLIHNQKEAQDLGNSLKYLLQTPKLRGNYGEEILEDMLEKVVPKLWKRQYSMEDGERVDAVVQYRDVVIPIDAKFPRESYESYLNTENIEEKKRSWKAYEDLIKQQINSIKTKYIKPHKGTTDFALMFIPSESIYYETIAEKNYFGEPCRIYEYARNNKVVPVSPNTFYAFLQIIMMGVRGLDIMKSAKKLQEALIKIERNFKQFYAKYQEIGYSLEKAQGAYKVGDTHIQRFKNSIESTINLDLPDTSKTPKINKK
ncbi:MAG: DNA recombination protein RmuC [Candidatus Omnitrophota bacterium]